MTLDDPLAALVAVAPGALVLPERPRGADVTVPEPLSLLGSVDLGDGAFVAVVRDGAGARWTAPLVVEGASLHRARAGDGVAERLVRLLATERDDDIVVRAWRTEAVTGERAITVDQTNESIVVGERAVVKWQVRLPEDGVVPPAPRRVATLADRAFAGIPAPWGLVQWRASPDTEPLLLADVAEFLPGAVDGWEWMVQDVRGYASGELDAESALAPARTLGALVADLHAALASTGVEPATPELTHTWHDRALADLERAVRDVDGDEGDRLRALAEQVETGLGRLADAAGTPLIDVHGDLHVGQVLRHGSPAAYAITDFDGSPVLAPADRSDRQPAALDVAGMMASLDHVGRVVVHRTEGVDVAAVLHWIEQAESCFLDSYRTALDGHGLGHLLDETLLHPLRLGQECREYLYALDHLPHWRYVPDSALPALLEPTTHPAPQE